jgi:hypothetical protein
MAKYCLTYDAKDALAWEPEELKLEISRLLLNNGGDYLESPVVSTILFEDGKDRSDLPSWNNLLAKNMQENIYYYLCVVARTKEGDHFERNEGDPDLNDDYQQLLEDLERD